MLQVISSFNYNTNMCEQISIFNYATYKRFNFCLSAKVLEIFNIDENFNFAHIKTINLTNKQVQILSKYAYLYEE